MGMFEYKTLSQLVRQYDAKDFPSPSRIFAGINPKQHAFFQKALQDKKSVVYKAVLSGRRVHKAFETGIAKDLFEEAVLRLYKKEVECDIDEVWAQEMGLVSLRHRFKGKFDGVGIFRGLPTIWDYKKVNRPKSIDQVQNYVKQCSAYAMAHSEMYGDINQIAIMLIAGKKKEDLSTEVFVFKNSELRQAKNNFLADLSTYQKILRAQKK